MARLNVNPTRMVLASLKKRLSVASRGHKLLKDKRDELMKTFLDLARENKVLREEVELMITGVYQNFSIANAVISSASKLASFSIAANLSIIGNTLDNSLIAESNSPEVVANPYE